MNIDQIKETRKHMVPHLALQGIFARPMTNQEYSEQVLGEEFVGEVEAGYLTEKRGDAEELEEAAAFVWMPADEFEKTYLSVETHIDRAVFTAAALKPIRLMLESDLKRANEMIEGGCDIHPTLRTETLMMRQLVLLDLFEEMMMNRFALADEAREADQSQEEDEEGIERSPD